MIFHKVCHYHTYQGGYGTYGNIDTACDHYDGKTAGDNQKTRVGYKQVQKHLRFRKSLVCKYDHTCGIHYEEQGNCNHQQQACVRHFLFLNITFCFHYFCPPSAAGVPEAFLLFSPAMNFLKVSL